MENIPEVIEQTLKVHTRLKGHVKKLESKADAESKVNLCCKYCGMHTYTCFIGECLLCPYAPATLYTFRALQSMNQKCTRLMALHDNLAELKSEYDSKRTLARELLGAVLHVVCILLATNAGSHVATGGNPEAAHLC